MHPPAVLAFPGDTLDRQHAKQLVSAGVIHTKVGHSIQMHVPRSQRFRLALIHLFEFVWASYLLQGKFDTVLNKDRTTGRAFSGSGSSMTIITFGEFWMGTSVLKD